MLNLKEGKEYSPRYWWINDESLAVLNRGYLLNGETVEGAVDRITTAAAKRLNNMELQPIFKEMVERGWMSLSSPIWANMGTQRGLPISCLTGDTLIEVKTDKGIITLPIEELTKKWEEGVRGYEIKVFNTDTKEIEYAKINKVWETKKTQSFIHISVGAANTYNLRCTPDHLILKADGEYVPAGDLKTFDKLQGESYKTVVDVVSVWADEEIPVFDIEVDHPSHNFYLPEPQIFVHNCFGASIPDNIEGITHKVGEVIMQTKIGGGTSGYFGELRGRGAAITDNGKSSGAVSFMKMFDTTMDVVSQGSTRRGSFAAYLDIDHPDVEEFLQIKDIGNPIQNLFFSVCVPDYWMQEMIDGDMEKRKLWARILESRQQKGLPYVFFTDNNNKNKSQIYKDLDLKITHSNLCCEISLPDSTDESFVCCLSSMNLELYDEWKDTNAVYYAIYFLDAVMSEFIEKTEDNYYLKNSHNFAKRHRALGLGVLGYHSYFQKHNISFNAPETKVITQEVFGYLRREALRATKALSKIYGPAPIYNEIENYPEHKKQRNTTVMAIAPTTSSSSILGQVSPGIEPYSSNYYKVGLAKGNFIRKNKYLTALLESKGKNTEEVWRQIMLAQGSVQGLDFLTPQEKEVFKTFRELSQRHILVLAQLRQKYIDQGQSLNINIPAEVPVKEVNAMMIDAWKWGIKGLYYQRSSSVAKELLTNIITCSSCES